MAVSTSNEPTTSVVEDGAIRPCGIEVPQEEIDELRSYWEGAQAGGGPFNAFDIRNLPVAVTVFPAEISRRRGAGASGPSIITSSLS